MYSRGTLALSLSRSKGWEIMGILASLAPTFDIRRHGPDGVAAELIPLAEMTWRPATTMVGLFLARSVGMLIKAGRI